MTLEEKITDCVKDLEIAYNADETEFVEYISERLAYLKELQRKQEMAVNKWVMDLFI